MLDDGKLARRRGGRDSDTPNPGKKYVNRSVHASLRIDDNLVVDETPDTYVQDLSLETPDGI
jgi:hypothetical protein